MALGPWDWQLSDRVSDAEVRGLLHSSDTSVSAVTERRLQEPKLPVGPGLRGTGVEGLRGRQANRQTHRFSFIAASPSTLSRGKGRGGWDGKSHIFCHLSILKGSQLTSHLHTHWFTHIHARLAADWKRFSVYCRVRGVDGDCTAPAGGLNIEQWHTKGRKNLSVIIKGAPPFRQPINASKQWYRNSFIGLLQQPIKSPYYVWLCKCKDDLEVKCHLFFKLLIEILLKHFITLLQVHAYMHSNQQFFVIF